MQLHYVIRKQLSRVDLQKDGTTSIGIVLKDGAKSGSRPVIKAIKKGSVAYRSHCVSERDAIVSVCGRDARGMSRRDFKHLLREAKSRIELVVEYQFREACLNRNGVYRMERIVLNLRKESETFGFVVRKEDMGNPESRGYPIISYVREDTPADRDGRLKSGDRLLQIDEQNLEALTLEQVADILRTKDEATFTVEYKIALIENSQIRLGERTYLEIDCPDADLGLVLASSGSRRVIEEILKGSLADRCGAFRVGDDILAINDIDVAFLSTSKANALLRNFKRKPGRIVLVANTERVALPSQSSYIPREKFNPLYNDMNSQLTPERDQQVPSNDHLLDLGNSPQSLFNGNFEDNTCSKCDHLKFQIETIVMLQDVIKNIASFESYIATLTRNNSIALTGSLVEVDRNRDQVNECGKLSRLCTLIKNSAHSMAWSLVRNWHAESGLRSNDCLPLLQNPDTVIQELMKNLVEIYSKKLISKHKFEKLQLKINTTNPICRKCFKYCMLAVLTTQEILLIVSVNSNSKEICFLIKKLTEDIFRFLPCKAHSEPQTGSEISRTTQHFRHLNVLSSRPSGLTHALKGEIARSSNDPIVSDFPGAAGVNTSDNLHTKPSTSSPLLFSSPRSVIGSSAKTSLSKDSSCEVVSYSNCKTKINNPIETSCYDRRYQKEQKSTADESLCFASPTYQPQNQSGLHNSSLGFTTPNPTHSKALDDSRSIIGQSTPKPPIKPANVQNNSFSYQAELSLYKDSRDCRQKDHGRNYSSNICKKIFREKGLQTMQRQNCKSSEILSDSKRDSPKPTIQKHASDPQFLSMGYQPSTEKVPNSTAKQEHFYANTDRVDGKKEIDDPNKYWSPFHRSDINDHPNILDIPNWSAKSSHSLRQIHQTSSETTVDTVDVTLKNEGKGYGLSVEFVGSASEDAFRVPRITAVSSQGAAHRIGILLKGDRVLTINGRNTAGMTAAELEYLKEEAFSGDEVFLTVEFDVVTRDLQVGTFDVCVTKTSKTGLIYNDFKKGSPLVVKGIVKGSPAHRCGSLLPGDEVLYANNIRQEFYDVFKNTYERSEYVIIRVRRQTFEDKLSDEIMMDQAELPPFKSYNLSRTSIHSNHASNRMFIEQELILYRDPVARDFGFLIGQDQVSKTIYVTDIRSDGPAERSKVIKKNDMILRVNGIDLETNKEGAIAPLFHPSGDRLELKTRRTLKYE